MPLSRGGDLRFSLIWRAITRELSIRGHAIFIFVSRYSTNQAFQQSTNRKMHSRIAHTRTLKDNARLAWKKKTKNNPLPMKLEQRRRTAAAKKH